MSTGSVPSLHDTFTQPAVVLYFLVLGYSVQYCFYNARKGWSIVAALGIVAVTWFYIFRWTLYYIEQGGNNLFDDAYVDVVQPPHFHLSSQLLTWVVVATIWMHDSSINYILFGMLGAMSAAFFTWVPNAPRSGRLIPLCYLPTSVLALFAVQQLPLHLHSEADFSFWLMALHVLLILPRWFVFMVPLQPKLDGTILYVILGVYVAVFHHLQSPTFASYAMPVTDCQISITTDMVLCTVVTIYYIYQKTGMSLQKTSLAVLLVPFISPGGVLALFLGLVVHGEGAHGRLVTWAQRELALKRGNSSSSARASGEDPLADSKEDKIWMNLGAGWQHGSYGDEAQGMLYKTACEQLATSLGSAVFEPDDCVLACGCGYGAELIFWKKKFVLNHITGIDVNDDAALKFLPRENMRLLSLPVESIVSHFENKGRFNKIVALDSVYHFPDKTKFFSDCATLLKNGVYAVRSGRQPPNEKASKKRSSKSRNAGAGGRDAPRVCSIGITDLVARRRDGSSALPFFVSCALRLMHVNVSELWSEEEYIRRLEEQGWVDVEIQSLETSSPSGGVLGGWFPSCFLHHLDYVLITAKRPPLSAKEAREVKRPLKVAIVGSGLSGLTAAHLLSGTHDVTIFEASPKGGLSGQGEKIFGQVVDIPLRIIGKGYYNYVEKLAEDLNIKLSPIRDDHLSQHNYGDNGPGGKPASVDYSTSWISNLLSYIPLTRDIYRFNRCIYNDSGNGQRDEGETWGQWLARHRYETSRYDQKGAKGENKKDPALFDSFIIWMLMGQASWILSCSYEKVLDYPATIILAFIRGLGWGDNVMDTIITSSFSGPKEGMMMRIHPSMRALEFALSYGCTIRNNTRVSEIDENLEFQGVKYDYVVLATEASSIKHILSPEIFPSVFSRVQYHPSTIVLHTDPSLMPSQKKDWKAFNVCQKDGHDSCMLTAWLNEYYPKADFRADVFQTWNPHKMPKNVLKECHFLRVVHTKDTPKMLKEIHRLQGKNNIFFAGAYSVEGMGLLEQAAQSGRKVAKLILSQTGKKMGQKRVKGKGKEKAARSVGKTGGSKESETVSNSGDGDKSADSPDWIMIS